MMHNQFLNFYPRIKEILMCLNVVLKTAKKASINAFDKIDIDRYVIPDFCSHEML